MGKSMAHDLVFGLGSNAKDRERRQMGVYWFAAEAQNGNPDSWDQASHSVLLHLRR